MDIEKIKKGLEACLHVTVCTPKCPYYELGTIEKECNQLLFDDCMEYIKEAERAEEELEALLTAEEDDRK